MAVVVVVGAEFPVVEAEDDVLEGAEVLAVAELLLVVGAFGVLLPFFAAVLLVLAGFFFSLVA